MEQQERNEKSSPSLGIIFDIDGTLIAEGDNIFNVQLRPGCVELMQFCKRRGHAVALWTAAHSDHAAYCARKICEQVVTTTNKDSIEKNGKQPHKCSGENCRETFDFVWSESKLRRQRKQIMNMTGDDGGAGCQWCGVYRNNCCRCQCWAYVYSCPCRFTKDLWKVWNSNDKETSRFVKERTLIMENTPQQCILNYGNAIYVPTYKGLFDPSAEKVFERFKALILHLETVDNVREFQKCSHGKAPHACFEQDWLCRPCE